MQSYLHPSLPACLPACLPAYLPACPLAYLRMHPRAKLAHVAKAMRAGRELLFSIIAIVMIIIVATSKVHDY